MKHLTMYAHPNSKSFNYVILESKGYEVSSFVDYFH